MPETTYTAMTMVAPRAFEKQQRAAPALGPYEVLVRTHFAGICGTDLAIVQGQYEVPLPRVLGHEFSGVVQAVGEKVSENWLGRRVVAEINNTCLSYKREERCPECKANRPNHCRQRTVLGIINADGAFAEFVKLPAENLHPLPDGIDDRTAVLIEPLAAAIRTFALCPLEHNARVVVVGAGRLGALIVAVAKHKGADVVAVSRSEERRAFASMFGASHVFAPSPSLPGQLRELWGGHLADVVVEASGSAAGLQTAVDCVRPKGTICLKTTIGEPSTINMTRIVVDEIALSASRCGSFCDAIHFLEQHPLPLQEWFQGEYPLAQLGTALQAASQPGKVLINLQESFRM